MYLPLNLSSSTTISPHLWFSQASSKLCLSSGPHMPVSSWHYKPTFATTKQQELGPPPHTRTLTQKDTQMHFYECSRNSGRSSEGAEPEYKMTDLFLFQRRVKLEGSPWFSPQPSIPCLSDPTGPPTCTLARGLALESGSQCRSKCD